MSRTWRRGASGKRIEGIGIEWYLGVIERDRHRWLDGVRDIYEHDFGIWEFGIKLTRYHHLNIAPFTSSQSLEVISFHFVSFNDVEE
jgi:hypothetical protein